MAKKKEVKKLRLNTWIKILVTLLVLIVTSIFILAKSTSEITFIGCGTDLPNYKYSLKFPFFWTFEQIKVDPGSTYYEVSGSNSVFTVSCTNQGIGGGCDEDYWTKINVNGKDYDACLQKIDGKWNMSNVNFSDTYVENATVSFWSEGLDRIEIEKILSTFKRL